MPALRERSAQQALHSYPRPAPPRLTRPRQRPQEETHRAHDDDLLCNAVCEPLSLKWLETGERRTVAQASVEDWFMHLHQTASMLPFVAHARSCPRGLSGSRPLCCDCAAARCQATERRERAATASRQADEGALVLVGGQLAHVKPHL